ncbi:MAG: glycosyltransferase family 4 protein [Planctomycetes bacterium]|nr:glycosyltransferase family 4 protein [Planctomycetota bacterium]
MRHRVAHVTTVHQRRDVRIFHKECVTLAAAGYDVSLVVGDGLGPETAEGVRIHDVGRRPSSRLLRMGLQPWRALQAVVAIAPDLVHLHDPELLPVAWHLRRRGHLVIYDAHEDTPRQILTKHWIPRACRPAAAWSVEQLEDLVARRLSGVVAATPVIRDRFRSLGCAAIDVKNYPLMHEFPVGAADGWERKERAVCYVGGISRARGVHEMVTAVGSSGARLLLAGSFMDGSAAQARALPGWRKVEELGQLDRPGVVRTLERAMAGLVLFQPAPNHVDALPNKLFEYMAAGLPVIASSFPAWEEIVRGHDCGHCVDPSDPGEIAAAIDRVLADPAEARRLGENGRRAVETAFSWQGEGQLLLRSYRRTLALE